MTTNDLIVNHNLNVDNIITYEKSGLFNTAVIRREDESTTPTIYLTELQIFVNDVNIMYNNRESFDAYFANWSDKDTPLPASQEGGVSRDVDPYLFDNVLSSGIETSGQTPINAIIIKDIPLTSVNDIQAIVLYNRAGGWIAPNANGLIIELYNTKDDPDLTNVLAYTSQITKGVFIYRYDFPSIDTYSLEFSPLSSTTLIPTPSYANGGTWNATIRSVASITTTPDPELNILANVVIDGTLTNTGLQSALNAKQNSIVVSTDLNCNTITTEGNATIGGNVSITGKLTNPNQPCFKAVSGISSQVPAGTPIKYNTEIVDNDNAHITSTGEYTIRKAGNWFFYYSFQSNGEAFNVQLQQNGVIRDQVSTDTTPTLNTDLGCKGMAIIPCVVDDVIRVFVFSGSVRVENADEYHSFGGYLIG